MYEILHKFGELGGSFARGSPFLADKIIENMAEIMSKDILARIL